jgi:hypothetical protein
MSDFEEVLERLLSDPSFQSALATDPDTALAGYALNAEERELLGTQLTAGAGGDRLVETRTTKSGVAGLLGPVVAALGVASGGSSTFSSAGSGAQAMGPATGSESFGAAPLNSESFGSADGEGSNEAFGPAGGGSKGMESMGPAETGADEGMGSAPLVEAANYRTRVDVDGDGSWDANRAYERADGGVDIHVDLNRDGVADFIGHDYDRDGLVDVAEFDNDIDGVMETRMYDDTGDGWMDREETIPGQGGGDAQSFGQAPAS